MYQALYRKWRPQTFDDVIGQKHITDSLRNQISSGRLSHAYLFIGTRGTGKTTCARILAKAVNCEHPVNGNPCGKCASCRGIADGSIMDIVELDAASNNGVDHVRSLRDEAVFSPADVKKRVYIIDEVHMLSTSAFNALLKIIEEPPEHLMFILATTELQKVPATILSRCQRHSFKRIEKSVLAEYVEKIAQAENIPITQDAADLIAGLAEGGVRDALSILDQCSAYGSINSEQVYTVIGLAGNQRIIQLFSAICDHDSSSVLSIYDTLWKDGKDPAALIKELSAFVRDILILKLAPQNAAGLIYGGYSSETLQKFSKALSRDELFSALDTLQNALSGMTSRMNPKMTAELCLVSLTQGLAGDSIAALKARISRLENALSSGKADFSRTVGNSAPVQELSSTPSSVAQETVHISSEETMVQSHAVLPTDSVLPEENTQNSVPSNEVWKNILDFVSSQIPIGTKVLIADTEKVNGTPDKDTYFINVAPGNDLIFRQLSKPDIIAKFETAVSVICGKKLNVRIRERDPASESAQGSVLSGPQESNRADHGDIHELKKFSEVIFS